MDDIIIKKIRGLSSSEHEYIYQFMINNHIQELESNNKQIIYNISSDLVSDEILDSLNDLINRIINIRNE